MTSNIKRYFSSTANNDNNFSPAKKPKLQETAKRSHNNLNARPSASSSASTSADNEQVQNVYNKNKSHVPLAEKMRPDNFNNYIGQSHLIGPGTMLHDLIQNGEIPSMILWGPPGSGKTSLVNVILKESQKYSKRPIKFVKMSAITDSINDVKKIVTDAQKQSKEGKHTVVFMDEIHRFNKLQQDIFLPHVEAGVFVLIGATTDNPSVSLNSALLSRCRVFTLSKLKKDELISIISKAIKMMNGEITKQANVTENISSNINYLIDPESVEWLADVCNGDARVALSALEATIKTILPNTDAVKDANKVPKKLNLSDVKTVLEKSKILTDTGSENLSRLHYELHQAILDDDEDNALYWLAQVMKIEDPVSIARRLLKIASEDITLEDVDAMNVAVSTVQASQMIGMPESDVILAHCAVYLTRAEKSRETMNAFEKCKNVIENHKGPQPEVPLFIKDRGGKGKLKAAFGKDYKNYLETQNQNQNFLPEGLENQNFFSDDN